MPEPAKTRQSRQSTSPTAADAATPDAVAEDAATETDAIAASSVDETNEVADVIAEAEADESDAVEESDADVEVEEDVEVDDQGADEVAEPAKPAKAAVPTPEKAPSKRQVERELKATEKRRIAAEQQRRKADFNAARIRQQEADRVQLWADRRQAEADKARAKAEKATAKADAARKAAGESPSDAAARRVASAERWEVYTQEKLDRTQSDADALRKRARKSGVHSTRTAGKVADPGSRQWVPPTFITVGLLGVIWLVVYYITASVAIYVPGMSDLGGWNVVIGMGLMASAFGIATLWK